MLQYTVCQVYYLMSHFFKNEVTSMQFNFANSVLISFILFGLFFMIKKTMFCINGNSTDTFLGNT